MKTQVDIDWPFQVEIAVSLFAKLQVLQFHYDRLEKFVGLIQIDTVCISLYYVILWKRWCTQSCGTSFTLAKQNVSLGTNGMSASLACLSQNSRALV